MKQNLLKENIIIIIIIIVFVVMFTLMKQIFKKEVHHEPELQRKEEL